jgi:hypothetical protein
MKGALTISQNTHVLKETSAPILVRLLRRLPARQALIEILQARVTNQNVGSVQLVTSVLKVESTPNHVIRVTPVHRARLSLPLVLLALTVQL